MPKISSKAKKIPTTNSARAYMEARGFHPLQEMIDMYNETIPAPDDPVTLRTAMMMGRELAEDDNGQTVLRLNPKFRFELLREMAGYYDAKVKAVDAVKEGESHGLIVEINNTIKGDTKEIPLPDLRQIQN